MVRMNFQLCQRDTRTPDCIVMLSQALQRNAKREAKLSNISGYLFQRYGKKDPRLKAWPRGLLSAALQLRFA